MAAPSDHPLFAEFLAEVQLRVKYQAGPAVRRFGGRPNVIQWGPPGDSVPYTFKPGSGGIEPQVKDALHCIHLWGLERNPLRRQ
jgi:hypothetical protein